MLILITATQEDYVMTDQTFARIEQAADREVERILLMDLVGEPLANVVGDDVYDDEDCLVSWTEDDVVDDYEDSYDYEAIDPDPYATSVDYADLAA